MTPKQCRIAGFAIGILSSSLLTSFLAVNQRGQNDELNEDSFLARLSGPIAHDSQELVDFLRTKWLLPASSKPYNLSHDLEHSNDVYFGLQGNLEIIKKLFLEEEKGFFVEAGALDGQYLSNTLWLEMEKGWTGLLVEPNPFSFQELRHKQRKAWISNSCVSSADYPKKIELVALEGYEKEYDYLYRGSSYIKGILYKSSKMRNYLKGAFQRTVKCQCFPLFSYLLALNVSTVDFLSLDVQGVEMDILRSFPFERVKVRVMVIEEMDSSAPRNSQLLHFVRSKNYTAITRFIYDYFFIHNGELGLIEKFRVANDSRS